MEAIRLGFSVTTSRRRAHGSPTALTVAICDQAVRFVKPNSKMAPFVQHVAATRTTRA